MQKSEPWACLGSVDTEAVRAWVESGVSWPPVKGGQPNRVQVPDEALPIINTVLGWFGSATYERACLSRLVPGATYRLHQDGQRPEWITRVHVPVITNPGAWFAWERLDNRVHLPAGYAYSFNTLILHAFGNDGNTDRVHLTFDVVRSGH